MAAPTIKISPRYVDLANNNGLLNGAEYGGPGTTTIKDSADTNTWVAVNINDVANLSAACYVTAIHYIFTYRSGTDAFHGSRAIRYSTRPIYRTSNTNHVIDSTWGKSTGDTGYWTKYCDADPSSSGECTYNDNFAIGITTAVGVQFKCESYKYTSFAREFYLKDVKVGYTRTRACYITFTGVNVPATTADGYTTTTRYYEYGATVVVPTPAARTGWTFKGWKTNPNSSSYLTSAQIPTAGEVDVTYTAYWEKTPYHVNVQTVNQSGNTITAPIGQTGDQTYYIDNNMTCTAPASDYIYDATTTYVFWYWSLHNANGGTIVGTYSGRDWMLGTLNTTNIPEWFVDSTNTVIAKAHYRRIYDITLSIANNAAKDPANVGKNGITSMTVVHDGTSTECTKQQVLDGAAVVRVINPAIQINTLFTDASEYQVDQVDGSGRGNNAFTNAWSGNTYSSSNTWTSSTGSYVITPLKSYFDLSISADVDSVAKIYSVTANGTRSQISATHIPRTTRLEIEIDNALMLTKAYDTTITGISDSISGNTSVSNGVGYISSLLRNHTINLNRSEAAKLTVTKTVYTDYGDPNGTTLTTEDHNVTRGSSATFEVAYEAGLTLTSASVTMGGSTTSIYVPSGATSLSYPPTGETFVITANCTFVAYRVHNSTAYMTVTTPVSQYGVVNMTGATSVLKSSFNGFTIGSIIANTEYEVVGASYRWVASSNGTTEIVGSGTINPSVYSSPATSITIQYPSTTIPTDKDIELIISVQFRKNVIYRSRGTGNNFDVKRPKSLWYTAVGQQPVEIVAVYAQTSSHTAPILLYGEVN